MIRSKYLVISNLIKSMLRFKSFLLLFIVLNYSCQIAHSATLSCQVMPISLQYEPDIPFANIFSLVTGTFLWDGSSSLETSVQAVIIGTDIYKKFNGLAVGNYLQYQSAMPVGKVPTPRSPLPTVYFVRGTVSLTGYGSDYCQGNITLTPKILSTDKTQTPNLPNNNQQTKQQQNNQLLNQKQPQLLIPQSQLQGLQKTPMKVLNRQPVYRFRRNINEQKQYYFTNQNQLPYRGWINERIAFYSAINAPNLIPVYQFHQDQTKTYGGFRYLLTTDDKQPLKYGWNYDSLAFWLVDKVPEGDKELKPILSFYKVLKDGGQTFVYGTDDSWLKQGWTKIQTKQTLYVYSDPVPTIAPSALQQTKKPQQFINDIKQQIIFVQFINLLPLNRKNYSNLRDCLFFLQDNQQVALQLKIPKPYPRFLVNLQFNSFLYGTDNQLI